MSRLVAELVRVGNVIATRCGINDPALHSWDQVVEKVLNTFDEECINCSTPIRSTRIFCPECEQNEKASKIRYP